MSVTERIRGGDWLFEAAHPARICTPERLTDEQRLIRQPADEFVANEVLPHLDVSDAAARVEIAARNGLATIIEAHERLAMIRDLMTIEPRNLVPARHRIAEAALNRRSYPFA